MPFNGMLTIRLIRSIANFLVLGSTVLAVGCGGGDGLDRYPIAGTVTFQGQPVASGAIFFEPTASVGQIAPTVYLAIKDGAYDAGDTGPVKGRYTVTVGGTDVSREFVDDDGITHTAPLFRDYKFEIDIPPPDNTLNVEVPASHALPRR